MIRTNIEKWLDYDFEPVECKTGKDFASFSRSFKREIKLQMDEIGCEIVGYIKGYFYISGFIYNTTNDKYMYFSIPDVRYDKDKWYSNILIRTAENAKDFRGGYNQYTTLNNFANKAVQILEIDREVNIAA